MLVSSLTDVICVDTISSRTSAMLVAPVLLIFGANLSNWWPLWVRVEAAAEHHLGYS